MSKYIVILLLGVTSLALAANTTHTKTKLSNIEKKITEVKTLLSSQQKQQDQLVTALADTEKSIGTLMPQIENLQESIGIKQHQLGDLNQQILLERNKLDTKKIALEKQLQQIYPLTRQSPLKLLLEPSYPNTLNRHLYYYRILSAKQISALRDFVTAVQQLQTNQTNLTNETKDLQQLKSQQQVALNELNNIKSNREQVLKDIHSSIDSKRQKLEALLSDKDSLQKILAQLKHKTFLKSLNFVALKGKLAWPTKGQMVAHFGSPIADSELKRSGVLIRAPKGQLVQAIYSGTVVFADWLRGFGLLIIVDHGNGYMSLYGRNQSLLKHKGDEVEAGENIATVGNSGGFTDPALYFALRYEGEAINPVAWCNKHTNRHLA